MYCSCCGFPQEHGVVLGQEWPTGWHRFFVCEACFRHPDLFFPAKRILPHWTLAIKTDKRINQFGTRRYVFGKPCKSMRETDDGEPTYSSGFWSKKAKAREAMSKSIYEGQRQISQFF